MIAHIHHPSCPAAVTFGASCICPMPEDDRRPACEDCGALGGWHALACTYWDDHCRRCAGQLVDVTAHECEPPELDHGDEPPADQLSAGDGSAAAYFRDRQLSSFQGGRLW